MSTTNPAPAFAHPGDGTEPNPNPDPLLAAPEAAVYLGVAEWTARALLREGVIPSVRFGRTVRVRVSALEAHIAANTQRGTR